MQKEETEARVKNETVSNLLTELKVTKKVSLVSNPAVFVDHCRDSFRHA